MSQLSVNEFFTETFENAFSGDHVDYDMSKYHLVSSNKVNPTGINQPGDALINRNFKHLSRLRNILDQISIENNSFAIPLSLTNVKLLTKSNGSRVRSSQVTVFLWEEEGLKYVIKIRSPHFVITRKEIGERANLGFVDETTFIDYIVSSNSLTHIHFPNVFFASEDIMVQEYVEGDEPIALTNEEINEILSLDKFINLKGRVKGIASDICTATKIPGVTRDVVKRNFIMSRGRLFCVDPLKLYF